MQTTVNQRVKIARETLGITQAQMPTLDLMKITGHSSISAFEKYVRDVLAELPRDYSQKMKGKLWDSLRS